MTSTEIILSGSLISAIVVLAVWIAWMIKQVLLWIRDDIAIWKEGRRNG